MTDPNELKPQLPLEFIKWLKIENGCLWFQENGEFNSDENSHRYCLAAKREFPNLALALFKMAEKIELPIFHLEEDLKSTLSGLIKQDAIAYFARGLQEALYLP